MPAEEDALQGLLWLTGARLWGRIRCEGCLIGQQCSLH